MANSYLAANIRKFVLLKALRIFAAKKIRNLRRTSRFSYVVTAIVIDIYFRVYIFYSLTYAHVGDILMN